MTSSSSNQNRPSMLVLDASYTLEMIRELGMETSVTCRDLDGFFHHVWSVHPFASMLTSEKWSRQFGKPDIHELGPRHTFIEGKFGQWPWLARFSLANFAISQLLLLFRLVRLVRKEGIKVIRVGDPLYLGLFGLALTRMTGLPMMIRVNGNNDKVRHNTNAPLYPRLFRNERIERAIERFVFPRAAMVAAPNPDNLEFAVSAGARKEVTTIFRYGNLLAPEHLKDPVDRPLNKVVFEKLKIEPNRFLLSVGRLQPLKFPEDCVHTLCELRKRGHNLKLVFAGEGELETSLRAQAKELDVTEWVVFAGNQTQAELAQLNAYCAAVLSPFTGRALSESGLGAAGIVAYDLDWQGELIEDNVTGFLVPFREKMLFVDAAERLITDPVMKKKLGSAVRVKALEILDPATLNEHERNEYRRILGIA